MRVLILVLTCVTFGDCLQYKELVVSAPYLFAEQMPSFPGEDKALFKYIFDNLKYPSILKEYEMDTGKIIV